MQFRTKQGLQTLRRARSFLVGRDVTVAMGSLTQHIASLTSIVERLETHAAEQETRARQVRMATDTKQAQGEALRRQFLRPLSRIAASLFRHDPTIRRGFVVPRGRDTEGLLQAAIGVADLAAQHQAMFVAQGLAPDFVARLQAAIAAFRATIESRGLDTGRRSAATAGLTHELRRGREQVRVIDDMLAPLLVADPDQLAEWRSISRFTRRAVVEEEGTPTPGTGPGTTPGTTTGTGPVTGPVGTPVVAPVSTPAIAQGASAAPDAAVEQAA